MRHSHRKRLVPATLAALFFASAWTGSTPRASASSSFMPETCVQITYDEAVDLCRDHYGGTSWEIAEGSAFQCGQNQLGGSEWEKTLLCKGGWLQGPNGTPLPIFYHAGIDG